MNKERAREIINTEVIETLKSHQQMSACFDYDDDGNAKPNNNYAYYDELLQALDIAIDSLNNTMTNREYMHLVGVQAILDTKFDLDKPLEKDFVKFLYALNQVEPYERKE